MELSGQMASLCRPVLIEELPSHLIVDILSNGGLSAIDLVHLELTCRAFGMNHGVLNPSNFRSLMDFVASQLCGAHLLFRRMTPSAQQTLLGRCNGNWKRMLGFLLAVDQDSDNFSSSKVIALIGSEGCNACGQERLGVEEAERRESGRGESKEMSSFFLLFNSNKNTTYSSLRLLHLLVKRYG